MPQLFGENLARADLLRRVGDISQVARAKLYRLAEGPEEGTLAVDMSTGSGLVFTVVPSRGLDISAASHNGRSLAWRSACGDTHPAYYDPHGLGWLRTFPGGLLTTCGLTWMGAPSVDDGHALGLHGRASNTPAYGVRCGGEWRGEDYVVFVEGAIRETVVFGDYLVLRRRIEAYLGQNRISLTDVVTNEGHATSPHMQLYHMNLGYPVVAPGSRLLTPSLAVTPRDAEAKGGADKHNVADEPTPGYAEQCFFHSMQAGEDGMVTTGLVNPAIGGGFGVRIAYRQAELPCFVQWKMMGQGTYVMGLEPANALVMGRAEERTAGRLKHLEPGESREYRVEVTVVDGPKDLADLEDATRV